MADPATGVRRPWTRNELILAFYLYCQTPFGRLHRHNPDVVQLAGSIARTPDAVAMKLCNMASLDPEIRDSGRKGLGNASMADRMVREAFMTDWDGMTAEGAQLLADMEPAQARAEPPLVRDTAVGYDTGLPPPEVDYTGRTRSSQVAQRIGQDFFRRAVLNEYQNRCCMSGLADARLLTASHIVPWQHDARNRLNPANGLCLSALHDRAFDRGLLALTGDLRILVAHDLRRATDPVVSRVLAALDGQAITRPQRFTPDPGFVAWHRQHVFVDAIPHGLSDAARGANP